MIQVNSSSEFKSKDIPTAPGVYLFRDETDELLYIGKAANLRQRVRSYFSDNPKSPKTRKLVSRIRTIEWIMVNNEVEALLLENKLVKQHVPKYNINLKDAKTFAYIALTRETFPRILSSRKISPKLESFGPYTYGFTRQDLQRLVVRVFKLRVCKEFPKRACLNFHMNLCSAPCVGKASQEQYAEQVNNARSFLAGNYVETIQTLCARMQVAAKEQRFEHALELRNQIASIRLLTEHQIVDNERRFDQDVMVFGHVNHRLQVVQMSIRKGVLLGKKDFSVEFQSDVEQEFLKAFYAVNIIPREILLNKACWQDTSEKKSLMQFLAHKRGGPVSLLVPRSATKLGLVKLAEKNLKTIAEEDAGLADLQSALNLPSLPRIIECFDVSNLGKEHVVSGMVRFVDGKPDKRNYRRFKIRSFDGQDDLAAMEEVVKRRYRRLTIEKSQLPDLIVVDGGPGQVAAAQSALRNLEVSLPLIGIAKENEEIYTLGEKKPLRFDVNSRMMLMVRKIRDEAHRFSLSYNIKRRQMKAKAEFETKKSWKSDLEEISRAQYSDE